MPKRSNLYYFRRLHQISLYDLETASGLSNQYISRAELLALEADLLKYRGRLLGLAEDMEHE